MIKKYIEAVIRNVDSEEGSFEVMASSGKVDRLSDTIDPKGWYLTNYKKNPVILWSHSTGGMFGEAIPPVAKAKKVWIEDEKELRIKGIWADTPFAQELRALVEGGFLNAVSVGFMPLVEDRKGLIEIEGKMYRRSTDEEIEKGIYSSENGEKFVKQELLEVSWVNVPALPQALVSARKMNLGLVTKALEKMESVETKEGRVLSEKNRKLINNCLKQMGIAMDVLKELHEATEPEKGIPPEVQRSQPEDKVKERAKSPELRYMHLANKAVENTLRKLKENKSAQKVEIHYLRIASKVIDAAIINAKENNENKR